MRKDQGTADLGLLVFLLGGTLIPAAIAIGTPEWLDSATAEFVLYGGAIAVAGGLWRHVRKWYRWALEHAAERDRQHAQLLEKHAEVIAWLTALTSRVERVEQHIAQPQE